MNIGNRYDSKILQINKVGFYKNVLKLNIGNEYNQNKTEYINVF